MTAPRSPPPAAAAAGARRQPHRRHRPRRGDRHRRDPGVDRRPQLLQRRQHPRHPHRHERARLRRHRADARHPLRLARPLGALRGEPLEPDRRRPDGRQPGEHPARGARRARRGRGDRPGERADRHEAQGERLHRHPRYGPDHQGLPRHQLPGHERCGAARVPVHRRHRHRTGADLDASSCCWSRSLGALLPGAHAHRQPHVRRRRQRAGLPPLRASAPPRR